MLLWFLYYIQFLNLDSTLMDNRDWQHRTMVSGPDCPHPFFFFFFTSGLKAVCWLHAARRTQSKRLWTTNKPDVTPNSVFCNSHMRGPKLKIKPLEHIKTKSSIFSFLIFRFFTCWIETENKTIGAYQNKVLHLQFLFWFLLPAGSKLEIKPVEHIKTKSSIFSFYFDLIYLLENCRHWISEMLKISFVQQEEEIQIKIWNHRFCFEMPLFF